MVFVVQFEDIYEDQPERLPERQQHMPAHLAFLTQHPNKVVASGAPCDSQEGTPLGYGRHTTAERSAMSQPLRKVSRRLRPRAMVFGPAGL